MFICLIHISFCVTKTNKPYVESWKTNHTFKTWFHYVPALCFITLLFQVMSLLLSRVSKSCNHTITRLRKIFEKLRKIWTYGCQTGKTVTNFIYLSKFDKAFLVSHIFYVILTHVSAQNFQPEHFDCAKEFAFIKSALVLNSYPFKPP